MNAIAGLFQRIGWIAGLVIAVGAVYIAGPFPLMDGELRLGGSIGLSVVIVLTTHPLAARFPGAPRAVRLGLWAVDVALIAGFVYTVFNFFEIYETLWHGIIILGTPVLLVGLFGCLVIIEAVRRVFGSILAAICLLAIVYAHFGTLPGILGHPGFSFEETIMAIWFSFSGVFGRPVDLVSSIVLIFILFGALLESTGATPILLKMSLAATGRIRGGSAHSAIVASALFGTISGSSVANVVGTGVFTIPMIKRQGFSPAFAGAVEAAASSGGQFTPPVMAAVAFLMADYVGVPYVTVAIAAAVPAAFYFFSLFSSVYAESARLGIQPVRERPQLTLVDWIDSMRFIVPVVVVVAVLFVGRSAAMAGFWAAVAALAVSLAIDVALPSRRHRIISYPSMLIDALRKGGQQCGSIMVAVAAIGIVIAVVSLTGLAGNFGAMVSQVAEGSLFLALATAGAASLLLGMGLPTLPAYLFIVLFVGPVIGKFGVEPLLIHLFVLYYGVLSSVTPPIAIAAYAAAPIAGANPLTTGLHAIRLAAPGFLIPFVFVYYPTMSLVMGFEWLGFIWIVVRLTVAVWLISTAFIGFEAHRLSPLERLLHVGAALAMLLTIFWVQLAAFALGCAIIALHRLKQRRSSAAENVSAGTRPAIET